MESVINKFKSTMQLIRSVTYVAKKVFLLM